MTVFQVGPAVQISDATQTGPDLNLPTEYLTQGEADVRYLQIPVVSPTPPADPATGDLWIPSS